MINILIRTSYRPVAFKRLLDSIANQTFKNIRILVSYDDDRALSYIPEGIEKIRVYKTEKLFWYDEYVNDLKELVTSGWFCVIDDEDWLIDNTALERVYKHLMGTSGLICQFSRGGRLKPSNEQIKNKHIVRGKIGMPCLFLHHSHKKAADLDGCRSASDFHWIKMVSRKVKLKFISEVVVYSEKRSYGKMS
jgi:hypothetical protein